MLRLIKRRLGKSLMRMLDQVLLEMLMVERMTMVETTFPRDPTPAKRLVSTPLRVARHGVRG